MPTGEFPEQSWIQGPGGIQDCCRISPVGILDLGSWILPDIEFLNRFFQYSIWGGIQDPRSKIQDVHGRISGAILDPGPEWQAGSDPKWFRVKVDCPNLQPLRLKLSELSF